MPYTIDFVASYNNSEARDYYAKYCAHLDTIKPGELITEYPFAETIYALAHDSDNFAILGQTIDHAGNVSYFEHGYPCGNAADDAAERAHVLTPASSGDLLGTLDYYCDPTTVEPYADALTYLGQFDVFVRSGPPRDVSATDHSTIIVTHYRVARVNA